MCFWRGLVFISLCSLSYSSHSMTDYKTNISTALDNICPGIPICYSSVPENPAGYLSCCTECSCDDNCSLVGDCCFPEKASEEDLRDQECAFINVPEPKKAEVHLYASYYMVTEPKATGCVRQHGVWNSQTLAAVPAESPPVTSQRTGKIYRNKELASCHGENDVLEWDGYLVCDKEQSARYKNTLFKEPYDIASYTEAAFPVSKRHPPYCQIFFRYPGEQKDIFKKRCYKDLITTCSSKTSFDVPPGLDWTHGDIQQACHSGFESPYVSMRNYANAFCHICNGEDFARFGKCLDRDFRTVFLNSFACLLNIERLRFISQRVERPGEVPVACPKNFESMNDCRTCFCPGGQHRAPNGTCIWVFEAIAVTSFEIKLNIDLNPPFPLPEDHSKGIFPHWLTSPWPADVWEIKSIHYNFTRSGEKPAVTQLVVSLVMNGENSTLRSIVETIDAMMSHSWKVSLGNVSMDLAQSFHGFRNGVELDILFSARTFSNGPRPFFITPLFFCEQVELEEGEYNIDEEHDYLTYNDKKIPQANFADVYGQGGKVSVRICLEESGLQIFNHVMALSVQTQQDMLFAWAKLLLINLVIWALL